MNNPTISPDQDCMTLINVFTVEPSSQQQLLDILIKSTDEVISQKPGFISASFHASADGTRVVNYAQWTDEESWRKAIFEDQDSGAHIAQIEGVGKPDYNTYSVVSVHKS